MTAAQFRAAHAPLGKEAADKIERLERMQANLHGHIKRLEGENTKLREALQAILAIDAWAEENQRIYDEKEARISGDDKRSL